MSDPLLEVTTGSSIGLADGFTCKRETVTASPAFVASFSSAVK